MKPSDQRLLDVVLVVVVVVVGERGAILNHPCTVFRGVKSENFVSKGV